MPHRYADDENYDKQLFYSGSVNSPAQIGAVVPTTPASIGPATVMPAAEKPKKPNKASKNEIWSSDEISKVGYYDDVQDTRETPQYVVLFVTLSLQKTFRYTISFKQSVSSNDAFLGMDPIRNASTNAADSIVIRIMLPKLKSISNVNVEANPNSLTVTSPE